MLVSELLGLLEDDDFLDETSRRERRELRHELLWNVPPVAVVAMLLAFGAEVLWRWCWTAGAAKAQSASRRWQAIFHRSASIAAERHSAGHAGDRPCR